jgi:ADP-ribosylglycohydrolase
MTPHDAAPTPSPLHAKIAGVLYGAASADALGGPVEGLDHRTIRQRHGRVETMLPYTKPVMEHAHFTSAPGSVTDDTRLHRITCDALLATEGRPSAGDLAAAIDAWREDHPDALSRSFIEEYHRAGLYRERKLPFGGHPTNGAIMSNHAIGAVHACDPREAFRIGFELAYITDGYAKEAAALHAAAVAAAMRPGATVEAVTHEAFAAADAFRRDGPHWARTVREQDWARFEGRPNHELVERALDAVRTHGDDPEALRDRLYDRMYVSPVGSEAGQTLAVALAMLHLHDGAYRDTVVSAVAYGRDNDSYATVAGAVAGALGGIEAVPSAWRDAVDAANPWLDLPAVADGLSAVVRRLQEDRRRTSRDVEALLA